MGNLARKFIDAIQNTMLDELFLRLVGLWWIGSISNSRDGNAHDNVMLGILVFGLVVFALAWLIGTVANHFGPRRHPAPSNGFEAWNPLPDDQLKPPRFMRAIVFALSSPRPAPWRAALGFVTFMGLLVLAFAVSRDPVPAWLLVHPSLHNPDFREALWFLSVSGIVWLTVLSWAGAQRWRIDPPAPADRQVPRWYDAAFMVVFVLGMGLIASTFWGVANWPLLFIGVVLLPIIIVPGWRNALMNALFGKRDDPLEGRADRL